MVSLYGGAHRNQVRWGRSVDGLIQWVEMTVHWLVTFVESLGVLGIFLMTFVESTFVPIPSEAIMIPAGYLIQQGKLPLVEVFAVSVLGTIGGAYFNYWLASHLGRGLFCAMENIS